MKITCDLFISICCYHFYRYLQIQYLSSLKTLRTCYLSRVIYSHLVGLLTVESGGLQYSLPMRRTLELYYYQIDSSDQSLCKEGMA